MKITVHVKVKFRAWGITFGSFDKTVEYPPLGIPKPPMKFEKLLIDERGVYVHLKVE
jgi:hypothetical protein